MITTDEQSGTAETRRPRLPKEFFPFKATMNRAWAREWYTYRYVVNARAVRMYETNDDLDAFIKEGKEAMKGVRNIAWAEFTKAALELVHEHKEWKIERSKQPPANLGELSSIISTQEWIDSVPTVVSDNALGVLAVSMFLENGDRTGWVKKAEEKAFDKLGVAGYEEAIKGRGTLAQVIKATASDKWKKGLSSKMMKNLGWSVGSRRDAKMSGKASYERMETEGGYVAYRVRILDVASASTPKKRVTEELRRTIKDFMQEGGTKEEMERITEEVMKEEGIEGG
jgi:hypothetical protein